jgi:4-hydroxy-tetrahydrodipicolinate synthase
MNDCAFHLSYIFMIRNHEQPKKIQGVLAASLTPMKENLDVDHDQLIAHCRWLLANGCNGVALMGTTGEANSLGVAERLDLLDAVVEAGISPARLLVGTGCCALPDTLALTRHALDHGVAGMLMLPPFYYKGVSEDGIYAAFDAVIQRIGDEALRIYLYHFPQMSAIPFSHALIERLLNQYPGIIAGIKDSSGDLDNMRSMTASFPGFDVFTGNDRYLLDVLRVGGVGCISATTNISCSLAGQLYTTWTTAEAEAEAIQEKLTGVRLAVQARPMIPALKGFMVRHTGNYGWKHIRPPHVMLPPEEIDALDQQLDAVAFSRA